jgi:hypothetical protein
LAGAVFRESAARDNLSGALAQPVAQSSAIDHSSPARDREEGLAQIRAGEVTETSGLVLVSGFDHLRHCEPLASEGDSPSLHHRC